MERIGPKVKSVIRLERDSAGNCTPVTLYEGKRRKRKKSSGPLRFLDDNLRRAVKAQKTAAGSYLERHGKSARRRRDGWMQDMPVNVVRATQKGAKKLRVWKMVPMID